MIDSEIESYLEETAAIVCLLDRQRIARMVEILSDLKRRQGRLFCLGVGGSAANASHAVCDFRKLAEIDALTPADNVAELTARTNDEGWSSSYADWLAVSRVGPCDVVLVLSVGGGSTEPAVSPNIVRALDFARAAGATVIGITGRDGGYTGRVADVCLIVPTVNAGRVTPHAEAFQGVILHLLATHSRVTRRSTHWEGLARV
jgi:D-sedoheptulose 7-phosphate isomerase